MQGRIPALALFLALESSLKTPAGREALNPRGLIPRAVRALKTHFPTLGILTDGALDPYTSHGQDGILNGAGEILNDETVVQLVAQARIQAEAGVDIVARSHLVE